MNAVLPPKAAAGILAVVLLVILMAGVASAADTPSAAAPEPGVYLSFNEGSGTTAFDLSGHGSSGTMFGVVREENAGCGRAMYFNGVGDYISIPYTSANHPVNAITVSTWFYADSYDPQVLVSTYNEGGYRLGFGDGNDLFWTVNLQGPGEISVPVQHESITLHKWHHVTGVYTGSAVKIYLDGILRNQVNATGPIHYEHNNYVILGAEAGPQDRPAMVCPHYLHGGLDEVKIYPAALPASQIIDNRLACTPAEDIPAHGRYLKTRADTVCNSNSGSLRLEPGEPAVRILTFSNPDEIGTWDVAVPPGSTFSLQARDLYSTSYADAWYIEIDDGNKKIDRSVAFPSTNNGPNEGVIQSGNATVKVKYFSGEDRFPATVELRFGSTPPTVPVVSVIAPSNILSNPIIVIYSASWATLLAVLLVVVWQHRRSKAGK